MAGGEFGLLEFPVRVHRPVGLEVASHPVEELRSPLLLRHLDGVVQAGDAGAALGQCVDLGEPVALQHRVAGAAVGEEEHRVGVVEGGRVGRPATPVDRGDDRQAGSVEAFFQEQRTGPELVLPLAVARFAGDEHDLLSAVGQPEPLEPDVLDLEFHRWPGVHLQREHALHRPLRGLLVGGLHHQLPVDEMRERVSLGDDGDVVPVVELDDLL